MVNSVAMAARKDGLNKDHFSIHCNKEVYLYLSINFFMSSFMFKSSTLA